MVERFNLVGCTLIESAATAPKSTRGQKAPPFLHYRSVKSGVHKYGRIPVHPLTLSVKGIAGDGFLIASSVGQYPKWA